MNNTIVYTVKEVSEILKTNVTYVNKLRKAGLLRFMKIGSYKVRKEELERFLLECEGLDITDPFNVTKLQEEQVSSQPV